MRLFPRAAKPDGTTILHYRRSRTGRVDCDRRDAAVRPELFKNLLVLICPDCAYGPPQFRSPVSSWTSSSSAHTRRALHSNAHLYPSPSIMMPSNDDELSSGMRVRRGNPASIYPTCVIYHLLPLALLQYLIVIVISGPTHLPAMLCSGSVSDQAQLQESQLSSCTCFPSLDYCSTSVINLVTAVNGFIPVSTTHHHVRLDGGRSHDQDTREGLAGYSAFPVGLFVRGSPSAIRMEPVLARNRPLTPRLCRDLGRRVQNRTGLSRRLSIRGVARGDLALQEPRHISDLWSGMHLQRLLFDAGVILCRCGDGSLMEYDARYRHMNVRRGSDLDIDVHCLSNLCTSRRWEFWHRIYPPRTHVVAHQLSGSVRHGRNHFSLHRIGNWAHDGFLLWKGGTVR
ncbi:hypothetical protein FPV67DRAFT_1457867 [Lyophyllum atratum]|nr:hypothetical protein FPV67DRAFT_1457867 [Lyophyllum atratum]